MKKIILISVAIAVIGYACSKKDTAGGSQQTFDQSAMLVNLSDNLIVPAYQELAQQSDSLANLVTQFAANPTIDLLNAVQVQFKTSYKAFIHCEPYDFGPANGTVMLINSVNYWPTKPDLINTELAASTEISDAYVNSLGAEKKGFPALGYLLFSLANGNGAIIDSFTTSPTTTRRKQYATALTTNVANLAKAVLQEWQTSYADTFKKNTGTEMNTSLSLVLNNFVINFETSKNKRIGIPIGRKDNFTEGAADPTAVELPYTDFAKDMLAETATTLTNIYEGKSASGDGAGFDDYVSSLNEDGDTLNTSIKKEFATFQSDISAIPSPMQTTVQSNPAPVYNAWVESKKLLVLLKVDLAADLNILITFSDNDGD